MNNIREINERIIRCVSEIKEGEIKGEVISIKVSNRHTYMTIKEGEYNMQCIGWSRIYEDIREGDRVEIKGRVNILRNNFTIYYKIEDMRKIGTGEYLQEIEKNRRKIEELGWDKKRRRIERFIYNIGIITAIEGAAIQDIIQAFRLDGVIGRVRIRNTIVQGKNSAMSIVNNIRYFNEEEEIDVVIITRGGGAMEDLKLHRSTTDCV